MATAEQRDDARFLKHLDDSQLAVWNVAKWLQSIGYAVTVNPTFKRPSHEQWKDYADNGDIEIRQRVEVKQISHAFTSAKDWPFGSKFIVCAKHSYDRAKPKPFAYIIVSADGLSYALVSTSTSDRWTVEKRSDARYEAGYQQEFYLCPLELVKWGRMK